MKWTQEELNVTRLLPCFPGPLLYPPLCDPSFSYLEQWTHTCSRSFHPYCYFRPPANPFLSFSRPASVFSLSHMQDRNSKETEEEICDVFRTSSQDGRCVEGGIQGACVAMSEGTCLHVCELACQSVYLWVSEQARRVSQSEVVSAGHSCRPPLLILSPPKPLVSGD